MADMTVEQAEKLCEEEASKLQEYFDAVQIMVSFGDGKGWYCVKRGAGNWYARMGMAREFLIFDQAQTNAQEIKQILPPPDADGDDWKVNG